MNYVDAMWNGKDKDLKLQLTNDELEELIGKSSFNTLDRLMDGTHDTVLLRRCMEHGKFIKFHKDYSFKTLQVPLNKEYQGGRLVYMTKRGLEFPDRTAGTYTRHANDIAHGVTCLESGVRYGLFLLQKTPS